jgi:hypothetical protein
MNFMEKQYALSDAAIWWCATNFFQQRWTLMYLLKFIFHCLLFLPASTPIRSYYHIELLTYIITW